MAKKFDQKNYGAFLAILVGFIIPLALFIFDSDTLSDWIVLVIINWLMKNFISTDYCWKLQKAGLIGLPFCTVAFCLQ